MSDLAVAALVRIARQRADLAHLDAVIRLLDPASDPETIRPKVPRNNGCDWFGRGELARMALEAIRDAPSPISAMDVARAVVARKGMEPGDAVALRRVKNMVDATLRQGEGGLVERVVYRPRSVGWKVATRDRVTEG
jgi:hypothetical protein